MPVQGEERAEPSLPAGAGAAPGPQQPRLCQWHGLLALLSLGMRGSSAVTGIKMSPCSSSCTPTRAPSAPPKETDPVLHQVEYIRCDGIVKAWLSHIFTHCLLNFPFHCILVKIWKTYGPTGITWCLAAGLSPLGKEAFAGRSVHLEPVVASDGVVLKLQTQKLEEPVRVAF